MIRLPFSRTLTLALAFAFAFALSLPACQESPQEPVDYPAVAAPRGTTTTTVGDWTVTLTRADVALGPFYFCASQSGSSTLCDSALAEIREVAVVNALSPVSAPIGRVRGFSGVIQSASYDFGISWFKTQNAPTPALALPRAHSMRLEGEARAGGTVIPFTADVDVVPQYQGQNAIATSPATGDIRSSAMRLEVVIDPVAWFRQVDFDEIAQTGKVPFAIEPGTTEHNALLLGIKNLSPPELRWVIAP